MADRYEDTESQINNYDKLKICLGSQLNINYGVIRHRGCIHDCPTRLTIYWLRAHIHMKF